MAFLAASWGAVILVPSLSAQTQAGAAPAPASGSAMDTLIGRLVQRGALTSQDGAELTAQADADAADAKVREAEANLAVAKAEAAVARAKAAAVQASQAQDRVRLAASALMQSAAAQQAAAQALLGQASTAAAAAGAPAPAPTYQNYSAAPQAPAQVAAVPQTVAPPPADSVPMPPAEVAPPPAETAAAPAAVQAPAAVAAAGMAAVASAPAPAPAYQNYSAAPQAPAQVAAAAPETMAPTTPGGLPTTTVPSTPNIDQQVTVVPMEPGQAPQTFSPVPQAQTPSAEAPAAVPAATAPPPAAAPAYYPPPAAAEPAAPLSVANTAAPAAAAAQSYAGGAAAAPPETVAAAGPDESNGTVRVAYVPEVVKNEIRQEVEGDVLAEARKEHWAGAEKVPEWVSRITLYGDVRVREEEIVNHTANDTTFGSFPNFNAVNTGSPIDYAAVQAGTIGLPQYNVNQNRNRMRFRARVGVAADLAGGFTAGVRVASGNDDNPVTENQTMGAAGATGQGGNFAKYAAWLDRAYIKYQGADPSRDLSFYLGRFDNPFFSSTLTWADGIGFDGAALIVPAKVHLGGKVDDGIKPFIVIGAFPVYNTDLNFGSDDSVKSPSYDKWLYAGQVGFDWKMSDFSLKSAFAIYDFHNIGGQLSKPFTPVLVTDTGSTDTSRPSFAQNGNTYMLLRDILPAASNSNGTIDQWQYFGLATPFRDLVFTDRLAYTHFEPFEVALTAEFARNSAFNPTLVAAKAINNFAITTDGSTGAYAGGNKAWLGNVVIGDAVLNGAGSWNVSFGYRYVETDSVVDGFTDADFGGSLLGTNLKGTTIEARIGITPAVWLQARWMGANAIIGPTFKNDLIQLDLNGRF